VEGQAVEEKCCKPVEGKYQFTKRRHFIIKVVLVSVLMLTELLAVIL